MQKNRRKPNDLRRPDYQKDCINKNRSNPHTLQEGSGPQPPSFSSERTLHLSPLRKREVSITPSPLHFQAKPKALLGFARDGASQEFVEQGCDSSPHRFFFSPQSFALQGGPDRGRNVPIALFHRPRTLLIDKRFLSIKHHRSSRWCFVVYSTVKLCVPIFRG